MRFFLFMRCSLTLLGLAILAASVASCGKKGDPLPPRRVVPATTNDLSVRLQGQVLALQFGYPQSTASGEVLAGVEAVEVWNLELPAADAEAPPEVDRLLFERQGRLLTTLAGVELDSAVSGDKIVLQLTLRRDLAPPDDPAEPPAEAFAVRTKSSTGEVSDFSNRVVLFLGPPPPAPEGLVARARATGIELEWRTADPEAFVQLYRRLPTERRYGAPIDRTEPGTTRYLDATAQIGASYFYTLRSSSSAESPIESAASNEIQIEYRDTFAPAPPADILALTEVGRVRLVIEPSPSPDVASYRVYRQDSGAEFRLVSERLLPTSADGPVEFEDRGLVSGQRYNYRITALDAAGNESEPAESTAVAIP